MRILYSSDAYSSDEKHANGQLHGDGNGEIGFATMESTESSEP